MISLFLGERCVSLLQGEENSSVYILSFVFSNRKNQRTPCFYIPFIGVSNGLIEFKSARKIWPLLELLAKFR